MDKETSDKISFYTFIVPEFAAAYKMTAQEGFFYLQKFGGWDFLCEHWKTLHTADPFDVVYYLYKICYNNGGLR